MAHAVENLIQDAELRKKLGLAAFERARNQFSASVIVPQYESFYRRICATAGSAGERLSFVEANHFRAQE
jgi:glycosyltransferase involved in cell wall biosynthesis